MRDMPKYGHQAGLLLRAKSCGAGSKGAGPVFAWEGAIHVVTMVAKGITTVVTIVKPKFPNLF